MAKALVSVALAAGCVFLVLLVWQVQLRDARVGASVTPNIDASIMHASTPLPTTTVTQDALATVTPGDNLPVRGSFMFATLATSSAFRELRLFLHALRTFHPGASVFIAGTEKVATMIRTLYSSQFPAHDVRVEASLDAQLEQSSKKGRPSMEAAGSWVKLMLAKTRVVDLALGSRSQAQVEDGVGVWLLDADVSLLRPIPKEHVPPLGADVGLSRHHVEDAIESRYGRYNGGYLFVRNTTFGKWWLAETQAHSDRYFYEQGTLDVAASLGGYRVHQLPITHNFGWWRFENPDRGNTAQRSRLFKASEDGIYYDGQPLISVHTHWTDKAHHGYNTFIESRLPKQHPLVGWIREARS